MKKIFLSALTLLILNSCQSTYEARQKNLEEIWKEHLTEDFNKNKTIEILVATNRNPKTAGFGCMDDNFGVDFSDQLNFGKCKVNVPKNHNVGDIALGNHYQPLDDYFKILYSEKFDEEALIKHLKKNDLPILLFVHGFNVKYNEAILRASGIAYDLKYQGPIVLFTWPSGPKDGFLEENLLNKTYAQNLNSAKNSVNVFKNFLIKLQKNNIAINLIVHSMGHQVALPALALINQENPDKIFINRLVLNAPDFEANQFKNISKNLKQISKNVSLYCSYNDKAMTASKTINNNERLGACAISDDSIDIINVSAIDDPTLGLGHSYYSSRAILTDVFQNLMGISADKRLFIVKSGGVLVLKK